MLSQKNIFFMIQQQPFGRIEEISQPTPVPAGQLRSSVVRYERLRSAVIARNTIHGTQISPNHTPASTLTMIRTAYQQPLQAHVIRDYIASHPRIFLPILFFLLGTLTYTVSEGCFSFEALASTRTIIDLRSNTHSNGRGQDKRLV